MSQMASPAERRLDRICRHFCPPLQKLNHVLHQAATRGGQEIDDVARDPVVIGGMVLDIHAIPSTSPQPRTTTPGKVRYVLGGVGRNIAECMSKLGTMPYMISAVGDDIAGNLLLEQWKLAGLCTEGIRKHQDINTAVICNVYDTDGELAAAVANVDALENFLTPAWIQQCKSSIRSAPILVVDANLSPIALEASCQVAAEFDVPVWFEPVSVAKSTRISSIAKYVTFASPNEDELVSMANAVSGGNTFHLVKRDGNRKYSGKSLFHKLKPAILVLLEKGIKMLAVTVGEDGLFLCSKNPDFLKFRLQITQNSRVGEWVYDTLTSTCPPRPVAAMQVEGSSPMFAVHFPALPASVVRLTGAGDCMVAGTVASLCSGLDVLQSVGVGIAAAKAAIEAEPNVPSIFNLADIAGNAKLAYCNAISLCHFEK
ncbi:unnamed protein product [Linum tenue]|uniref:Carbohydrate kinase PfkB domain-containing protein n=1 Tax=Linum tenue TaxID=586396 RepID=A0AAV0PHX7_9ROSI|nr:unnamed protein product [Linum tenue]